MTAFRGGLPRRPSRAPFFGQPRPSPSPAISIGGGGGLSYDASAEALFSAFTSQPHLERKALINGVIVSLKNAGIWPKLDGLWVCAANSAPNSLINWVSPGTYNLTGSGSPAFTADRGYLGDGAAAYLDTGFNASTAGGNFAQNDATIFAWGLKAAQDAGAIYGTTAATSVEIYPRFTDDKAYFQLSNVSDGSFAVTTGVNFLSASRAAAGTFTPYVNGVAQTPMAITSAALANANHLLLRKATDYYGGTVAIGGCGSSLSASQHAALYAALFVYIKGVGAL